ncbi:YgjV family protein [Candidatus Pacebacteria bacterium]|nr:YgjV family protein [Candidatus Paceibacterota bacterium]
MFELFPSDEYLVYGIGYLAFAVMALSFQLNVRQHILYLQVVAMILLGVHLYFIGAMTGAGMMIVMITRNLVFAQKERFAWAANEKIFYGFLLAIVVMGTYFWTGLESLSAMTGSILATVAFWLSEPRKIRIVALLSALGWAPYGLYTESFPLLLLQIFIVSSILIAMYRYDWGREKPASSKEAGQSARDSE